MSMTRGGITGIDLNSTGFFVPTATSVNNGATITYTYPANTSYVYVTTSAASLQVTLPTASASINKLVVEIVTSANVATATWVNPGGATVVGGPSSFALNTPVRMIYIHADLKWYPY